MWRTICDEFRRWARTSGVGSDAPRTTRITVETEQVWIIRGVQATRGWCEECGREADLVGLKQAEGLCGVSQGTVAHTAVSQSPGIATLLPSSVDGSEWHWSQAPDGSSLICVESLLRARAKNCKGTKTR